MVTKKSQSKTGDSTALSYAKVMQELRAGVLRPLYLLYGEEEYLSQHVLQTILGLALNPAAKSLDGRQLDAQSKPSQLSFSQLAQELKTPAFMSPKRVLIIRDSALFTSAGNSYVESAAQLLDAVNPYAVLVFFEAKVEKRNRKLLQEIDKKGARVETSAEDLPTLLNWSKKYLQRYGIQISGDAAESLAERCGRSMQQMRMELAKLSLAARGSGRTMIDEAYINEVCIPDVRGSIFQLTDAIAQQQSEQALRIYSNMLEQRTAPQYILFMVARHFRQLLVASEAASVQDLMSRLACGKFVADKLWRQKAKFKQEQLSFIYLLCAESDYGIKSGKMDESNALELLILQALRPPLIDGSGLR